MKKKYLFFLSIAAISALAACNVNKPSSSSSSIDVDSSSSEPSTSSSESSSSSSSSSSEDIGPVPTEIIIPQVEFEQDYAAAMAYSDYLLLNYKTLSLVADNGNNSDYSTKQVRGLPRALQSAADLSFRSLDSSIAEVDANGNVKGIKAGYTQIEVADKNHDGVKVMLPVNVFSGLVPEVVGVKYKQEEIDAAQPGDPAYGKTTDDYKVEPAANEQEAVNEVADVVATIDDRYLKEVVDHELREMSTYKNGKRQFYQVWDEHIVMSEEEAYLRIIETDGDTKTEDGAMSFTDYEWLFFTNEYYDTYAFHTKGDVKNYYPVSTVEYMPADPNVNNRTAPLFDILDNIFTAGRDIFVDSLEDARISNSNKDIGKDPVTDLITKPYTNVKKNMAGVLYDGSGVSSKQDLFFDVTLDFDDEEANQDTESNYGVPYGTPMPAIQRMIYTIRDGKLLNCRIELEQNYSFGGDVYKKVYCIDHTYERINDSNRSKWISYPDKAEYTLVDYLFAIQSIVRQKNTNKAVPL